MARISIIVEFTFPEEHAATLDALFREHARLTREEEPGCLAFDAMYPLRDDGTHDAGRIVLVEMYADNAAITAHRANPRMPKVAAVYGPLITGRTLVMCELAD